MNPSGGRWLPHVVVTLMVIPAYRRHLLEVLEDWDVDIGFYAGEGYFIEGVTTEVRSPLISSTGPNRFFLGRRIAWQRRAVRLAVRAPVAVIEINPRIVNSWLALGLRAILRRPTVGWGHAHPRRGPTGATVGLRRLMQVACTGLLTYTSSDAEYLRQVFPRKRISVATNSLYPQRLMQPADDGRPPRDVVVIGRLVAEKKPHLAVEAFLRAKDSLPPDSLLHVVGDGPLHDELVDAVRRHDLDPRVVFHGKVFDVDELRRIFSRSVVMLATGYVGLNVTQALGFGVTVVYPDEEPHAPEVEALHERNSMSFIAGDATSCSEVLVAAVGRALAERGARERISEETRNLYSSEAMARAFLAASGA